MKKLVFVLMLAVVATLSVNANRYRPGNLSISIQTFYDELSPYGDWLYTPEYGYVWHPFFDRPEAFRPYSSNGDWAYTEYGWTWVSDYRWGWAPFHYGRWYFDDYLGWMWIPGYEWAPAWVTWGSYNNYWGWAPLGPEIYVNVNFNWSAPDPWWTFVPCRHFYSHDWHNYIYDRPVHITNITYITNIYGDDHDRNNNHWFRGPRVNDVERYGRTRVHRMEVVASERPENRRVDNSRISIYNPRVEQNRESYRPVESRNIETTRSGNRMNQQNPRTNDPGVNRVRENRGDIRQDRQVTPERTTHETGTQPARRDQETEREIQNKEENRTGRNQNKEVNSRDNSQKRTEAAPKNERKSNNRNNESSKKRDTRDNSSDKSTERNHRK
jgi:hypothetical protein